MSWSNSNMYSQVGKIKRNILNDTGNENFGYRAESISGFFLKANCLMSLASFFPFKIQKKLTMKRALFNEQSMQCAV